MGMINGNASTARIITELIAQNLDPMTGLPSLPEALGVLLGESLLLSAQDTPLTEFWVKLL